MDEPWLEAISDAEDNSNGNDQANSYEPLYTPEYSDFPDMTGRICGYGNVYAFGVPAEL